MAVRVASPADAVTIAELATTTFRDTFATQNTPEDMEDYLDTAFSLGRVRSDLEHPESCFLLAFSDDGQAIGYARLLGGDANSAVRGPRPIQLERLYVRREAQKGGIGTALMRACIERAGLLRHQTLWLGVWENNPKAIAFYERWGFEHVGSHLFKLGSDQQVDAIMERPVRQPPRTAATGGPPST